MKFMKLNIQLFAVNASKSVNLTASSASSSHYTLTGSFTESTLTQTNITNNTSTLSITGTLASDSYGAFSTSNGGTLTVHWYDDNENSKGKQVISQKVNSLNASSKATYSTSLTVTHKSDGSLSGYVKATWTKNGSTTFIPNSGSVQTGNTTLTKIARATPAPSVTGSVGIATNITLQRASGTSYTHTLRYTFGSLNNQTIATNVGTSYSWTMPTSFYAQIGATAKSRTGTLYVDTYSGSTLIGTDSATFTANVNENLAKLNISVSGVTDINSVTANLTSGSSTSNKIVSNASTARLNYNITSPSNANISSVVINNETASTSATYKDFTKISNQSFTIVATDSRGFTTTFSYTILTTNWINYVPVTVSGTALRPDAISGKVDLKFSGNYWSGNFGTTNNSLFVKYRYKKTSDNVWSSWNPTTGIPYTISGTTFENKNVETITGIDVESSYNFQFQAYDKVNVDGFIYDVIIDKATSVMWWNNTDIYFENKVNVENGLLLNGNPVGVEIDSNENGTYRKYEDGTLICYGSRTTSADLTSSANGAYYNVYSITYPMAFEEPPIFIPSLMQDSGVMWISMGNENNHTSSGTQVRIVSNTSQSSKTITIFYLAIGKWK